MDFTQSKTSPCIFKWNLIENYPIIYLGLYVDNFIYFSQSKEVETKFEQEFQSHVPVTFKSKINYFLGVRFHNTCHKDGHIDIALSQTAYIDNLCKHTKLNSPEINTPKSPYRSGFPIDTVPDETYNDITQKRLTTQLQTIIGLLNWLSVSTCLDITTATSLVTKYCQNPSKGHIDAALYIVKYLKGTQTMKMKFSSQDNKDLQSFIQFPLPQQQLFGLCDTNWGHRTNQKHYQIAPP